MSTNSNEQSYTKIDIREAVTGDEVYQAGEWAPIAWVKLMQHSDSVTVGWPGGGTHSAPAHHFMARRAHGFSKIAEQLDGAVLPELSDEQLRAEEDAQIEFERTERERMISDIRDRHGDEAAAMVRNGWTVDAALDHIEGVCDHQLCTGEHGRSHFILDIDAEGDAVSSDRAELARMLRLVADRIEVGVYSGNVQDINGNTVGSHSFQMTEA